MYHLFHLLRLYQLLSIIQYMILATIQIRNEYINQASAADCIQYYYITLSRRFLVNLRVFNNLRCFVIQNPSFRLTCCSSFLSWFMPQFYGGFDSDFGHFFQVSCFCFKLLCTFDSGLWHRLWGLHLYRCHLY